MLLVFLCYSTEDVGWPTCDKGWARLVGFDGKVKAHLGFHTYGPASAVFALVLMLLQVDFGRVKGHVGMELSNISRPDRRGESNQMCSVSHLLVPFLSLTAKSVTNWRRSESKRVITHIKQAFQTF